MILFHRCWVCGDIATELDSLMGEYSCDKHYMGDEK